MARKDPDRTGRDQTMLPPHLRALLETDNDEQLQQGIRKVLEIDETTSIRTGRVSRALRMGSMAAGTGRRWLTQRAKRLIMHSTSAQEDARAAGIETAVELVKAFAELRGAAMKLGQMLSYVDDALPKEMRAILSMLTRDAPPMPWNTLRSQFEEEFGNPPENIFSDFEETPMAAASIGQVHRARLPDGRAVAVKIQYPGVLESLQADLKNSNVLMTFHRFLGFGVNTRELLTELETRLLDECDYRKEAAYQIRFGRRFANHPHIVVPAVVHEHSGRRILTTELYEGLSFYQWLASNPSPEQRNLASRMLYRFYQGSFYLDGLFNCDPHPGNYLFTEDNRFVFFDYGCARTYAPSRRRLWIGLNRAVVNDDRDQIRHHAMALGFFTAKTKLDFDAFVEMMRVAYKPYLSPGPFPFHEDKPGDNFRTLFTSNPNFRKLNMPADGVFLNRIMFGIFSLLGQIGGELDVHRQAGAYFQGEDPDWPDDPALQPPRPWDSLEPAPTLDNADAPESITPPLAEPA